MKNILLTCLLFALPASLCAQRFGGTPPSVKWKQIDTDSARIIFPAGLDSQAQRVAMLIHYEAARKQAALGGEVRKIDVVLQNQTTIANGYVGLGPFRSEFYLTPSFNNFDLGSLPWADQLAIHEYRHVEQFNNFHHGLSQLMYTLFGEEGYALAVNAAVPDWFYEGDAVYNETVLSQQGRGRLSSFLNAYPSLWQAHKNYSWMKLRNGSYKDYVPNHYNLGYLLVNYGFEKYGADFWGRVTRDAAAFKGLFYPFQKAIERQAGVSYPVFRREALNHYKTKMPPALQEQASPVAGPSPVFPLNTRVVTNRVFPYAVSGDSLVYLKSSYDRRPSFFLKDAAGEHVLRVRDISNDDQFSYRNGRIVYAAYESDPRWSWRDYSVLRVFDLHTRRQHTVTHRSKYFSPDISASGNHIVAVQETIAGKSELDILDANTGAVQYRIASPDVLVFTDPKFLSEDTIVTAVRLRDGRMALALADARSGVMRLITPASFNIVGYPCVSGRDVYFTASYGGGDNVFVVRLGEQQLYRVTNWPLGNYFVNVQNGKMSWSVFTAEGYQLQQEELSLLKWEPVGEMETAQLQTPYPVSDAGKGDVIVPGKLLARQFPVSDYRSGTRLINLHSWRPYYEDPEFTFSLYGENVLNTLQTELYYLYNRDDRTHAAGLSFLYGKWFPYLGAGTQYTFNCSQRVGNKVREWSELDSRVGLSIPLNWASGQTYKQLNFGSNLYYRNDFNKGAFKDSFVNINFAYLQHFLQFSQQVAMAPQHIFPRLGYQVSFEFRHAITKYNSWQFLGNGSLYLPGFLPSHSIVLTGAYQETDTSTVLFGNRIPYARGYNAAYFSRMWKGSANYHFPLFYPDWGFGNILYLQRIRANIFYDFMRVYSNNKLATADQRSVGGELYFDTKWWNQYQLSFGLRVSHLLDTDFYSGRKGGTVVEVVLPVSIFPK